MHKYQSHDSSDDVVVEQETYTAEPDSVLADASNQDDDRVSICSPTAENDDSSDAGFPHGEVGSSAAELARNLPDLVDHMRRLRLEMEKCNKIYEAINLGHRASKGAFGDDMMAGANDEHAGMYRESDLFGHEDSYSSKTSGNSRDPYEGMSQEDYDNFGPPVTRGSMSVRRSQQMQKMPSQRPSLRMSMVSAVVQNVSYSVMWVSGECGISLRNFSTNKIGAQIAVLQQADGVTTGISNCRLGDQLVTVNDDRVEDLRFKDIVQKLKSTRRPISLGFRTNQNVQTSPTAASSLSRSTINSISRTSSSRGFMNGADYDDFGRPSQAASAMDGGVDRQTYSSMRSSTSTLSDDVEVFCKEQEEMHSDIIVLLTETVLRCERLQQENLDQLQSLMQLAPNLQTAPSQQSVMALSSLAPVESPAAAAKIRASLLEASQLSRTAATTATSA